jgi:hypothetical protein
VNRPEFNTPNADDFLNALMQLPREQQLRLLRRVSQSAPPGLADQITAASTDAEAAVWEILGAGSKWATLPGWAWLGALDTLVGWIQGTARTCLHTPHPERPEPVFAAAWRPGVVACRRCTHLLRVGSAIRDATCDGCGHVCLGVAAGDGITPSAFPFGPLTFWAGACKDCTGTPYA